MACTVTREDIQKRIKNQLADNFDSIKFTKYSDRVVGFIPYDSSNPSKPVLYGKVKKLESQLNEDFQSSEFGPVVSLNQTSDGVQIIVQPSYKLAQAMTSQNEMDENPVYNSRQIIKEGVDFVFEQNPELNNIGTPQQYSAYLDSIFPNSKMKGIVYHGSKEKFDNVDISKSKFQKGFYFAKDKTIAQGYGTLMSLLVNSKNTQIIPQAHFGYYTDSKQDLEIFLNKLELLKKENNLKNSLALQLIDVTNEIRFFNNKKEKENFAQKNSGWKNIEKSLIDNKIKETKSLLESIKNNGEFDTMLTHNDDSQLSLYAVGKSEQIHILGNNKDIEGFKNFTNTFNSRYSEREDNEEVNKPLGDNYVELVNYKESELKKAEANIKRLKQHMYTQDTSQNRAKMKELEQSKQTLENQLEILASNDVDFMFHAVIDDLDAMEQALKSSDAHEVQEVKNKLNWYNEFADGLRNYENKEDYKEIAGKIKQLMADYKQLIQDKVLERMNESFLVQDLLTNLNTDDKAATQLSMTPNESGEYDPITTKDLLKANSDISVLDREFLGLISSTTGDTVLPQYLMAETRLAIQDRMDYAHAQIDKLNSFLNRNPDLKNNEFLFSKDAKGNKDGFIVDLYSGAWFKALGSRKYILKEYYDAIRTEGTSTRKAYIDVLDWYQKNAEVIDFTRLNIVKDIYGQNPEYARYFTRSDEDINAYEENLKQQLGPRYDEIVETLLNKLEKFEEFKQETEGDFAEKNIAQRNLWEFLSKYRANDNSAIGYTYGDANTQSEVYFSNFSDVPILPKSRIKKREITPEGVNYEEVDSGFYSEAFQDVIKDPRKVELWQMYKDMSEFIDATYNIENYGRIAYPKVETLLGERIIETLKDLKQGKLDKKAWDTVHATLHEFKSYIYEQGVNNTEDGVVLPNNSDTSKREITQLAKAKMLKGMSKDAAYEQARKQILNLYSEDINKTFKAVLVEAALHQARLDVQPVAESILEVHKGITDKDNKERKNSIARMEYYINKIIYNRTEKARGKDNTSGKDLSKNSLMTDILNKFRKGDTRLDNQTLKLYTDADKILLAELKEVKETGPVGEFIIKDRGVVLQSVYDAENKEWFYNVNGEIVDKKDFDIAFNDYIIDKINSLGLDTSLVGLTDGVIKTVVLKGLALNPLSGIFNRVEGAHSIMLMDMTGEYWTPGNSDWAKEWMSWTNTIKLHGDRIPGINEKQTQVKIFQQFLTKLGTLQDRKNELQRNVDDSQFNEERLNIFQWAVEHPEFKNQGTIILSMMADTQVIDAQGNSHPLIDMQTGKIAPFDLVNGVMQLKSEFSNFYEANKDTMNKLVLKIEDGVSHSQGNYNQYDIMKWKSKWWGRATSTFMTWFPEHINQRMGFRSNPGELNVNLPQGKLKKDSRYIAAYKASKPAYFVHLLAVMGISYGALSMAGLIGTGLIGAFVYQKFFKKIASEQSIKRDANHAKDIATFLQSALIESLNYPSRIASSIPGVKYARINNKSFKKSNMSQDEMNALRALSRELGVMLTLLAIKMAMSALLYDKDDDRESDARMRHNFVQNQMTKSVNALASFSNPGVLAQDASRIALASQLGEIGSFLNNSIINPDWEKAQKSFWKVTPVPRILTKGEVPWHDKMNYDDMKTVSDVPKPFKWVTDFTKDNATNDEFSAEKAYNKERAEMRDEIRAELMDEYGHNKKALELMVNREMKKRIGTKYKELDYKDALESIEDGEIMKRPTKSKRKVNKAKASRKERETYKDNLKEAGLSDREISQAMREEFNNR
jgi:hypothetical protein